MIAVAGWGWVIVGIGAPVLYCLIGVFWAGVAYRYEEKDLGQDWGEAGFYVALWPVLVIGAPFYYLFRFAVRGAEKIAAQKHTKKRW